MESKTTIIAEQLIAEENIKLAKIAKLKNVTKKQIEKKNEILFLKKLQKKHLEEEKDLQRYNEKIIYSESEYQLYLKLHILNRCNYNYVDEINILMYEKHKLEDLINLRKQFFWWNKKYLNNSIASYKKQIEEINEKIHDKQIDQYVENKDWYNMARYENQTYHPCHLAEPNKSAKIITLNNFFTEYATICLMDGYQENIEYPVEDTPTWAWLAYECSKRFANGKKIHLVYENRKINFKEQYKRIG